MSKQVVESIIGKALLDIEFRKALLADADAALTGLDLTPAEKESLKALDTETLDSMGGTLDARTSKRPIRPQ